MKRRDFIAGTLSLAPFLSLRPAKAAADETGPFIMTVNGPVEPDALGPVLSHEHVLVDFIGADRISPDRYDPDEAFNVILPYLEELGKFGCRALVE